MNFLNKAKETANKINEGTNVKPSLPGIKPGVPGKPPGAPGKPPTAPGKPPVGNKPGVPGKPPVKPVSVGAPTPVKDVEIAPVVEEPKATAPLKNNNPFVKKPDTSAPKEEKVEEVKDENPHALAQTAVNAVEETNAKEVAEVVLVEEVKEDPKASPKKGGKKKTPAKASESVIVSDANVEVLTDLVIPKTQVVLEEALASIKSGFIDEAWEAFREENANKINEIAISNDMTPAMIKSTLSELSLMKDSIWLIFNDTKTIFENLTAKEPEGTIERIKKISSKGSNPEERKLNATLAVMNYKDENGNRVNLYELLDEMRDRYNFTKSLMDQIAYKNSVLITMLGSLKLEK